MFILNDPVRARLHGGYNTRAEKKYFELAALWRLSQIIPVYFLLQSMY